MLKNVTYSELVVDSFK